jgi:beta-1,4-mannosyltransferase
LVKHGENGLVFGDATELAQQIQDWFRITSKGNSNHKKFRENLKTFQAIRWHENWKRNAKPLFS